MTTPRFAVLLSFFCSISFLHLQANTLHVPVDYPTIQSAIDQAETGDTVLVGPGTYPERLKFRGKDIVLASHFLTTGDPAFIEQTIIDAEHLGIAILLEEGETEATVITGFTIAGGGKEEEVLMPEFAGSIVCVGASPQILHNNIKNAYAVTMNYFGGIVCSHSHALIEYNRIDSIFGAFVQKTGGVVSHQSTTTIRYNEIKNISGGYVFQIGGGIVADSSDVLIEYNLIDSSNFDSNVRQGGIALVNSQGGIINNTIVHHNQGLRLEQSSQVNLVNNIIFYNQGLSEDFDNISIADSLSVLSARFNDIEGGVTDDTNLDAEPMFVNKETDFHLQANSPCIDQGDPNSPNDPDGTRADMGAFYFELVNSVNQSRDIPNLEVFPNPTSDAFFIKKELRKSNLLEVYNIWGQLQLRMTPDRNGMTKVAVHHLQNGTYFLLLKENQGLVARSKIVIAH